MSKKKFERKRFTFFFLVFAVAIVASGFFTGKVLSETFLKANIARYGSANLSTGIVVEPNKKPTLVSLVNPPTTLSSGSLQQTPTSTTNSFSVPAAPKLTQIPHTQETQEARAINFPGKESCEFLEPKKAIYSGHFVSLSKPESINPDGIAEVKILIQNTGNMPWFSSESGCGNVPIAYLGTAFERDRVSPFFLDASTLIGGSQQSNWIGTNRIKMQNKRVDPAQIAVFTFLIKAPEEPGIYREIYAPVIEGRSWIEGLAVVAVDINVGPVAPIDSPYFPFIYQSTNLSKLDLSGEKSIEISLSQQTMQLKIGDLVIRTFPVSTGSYKHPTPPGSYHILLKQKLRIAGSRPHYIMPLFMMFKAGGYGIHALPSLANDHGVFWTEALNHIGSPRSHGCIRLLPDDAEFAWGFTDVGTAVVVVR